MPTSTGVCISLSMTHVMHGIGMQETCPVHVIGPFLDSVAHGSKIFDGTTAATALCTLRFILGQIGVERATDYRTHDLRRGHAQDLVESGTEFVAGAPYCDAHF